MLPYTGSLKWTQTLPWICRLPYQKPSGPCSRFPAVKDEIRHNPTASLQARWAPADGRTHNTLPPQSHQKTTSMRHLVAQHRWEDLRYRQLCDNHRGISLLKIAGKIFALPPTPRDNRYDLCRSPATREVSGDARTTDMTCQLQEKFQEMRTHLYTTFVDLNGHLKQGLLPESQCGFRRHRGTTDMIFAARSRKANVASADTAEQPI
ncbi:unnamed protein product [Schistocephalus solidus]|uniref:Reverse transcriptase domain-containing protein n=1 Tax=Schistocephalus solidus TaxID=70667 RepID=A0A183SBY6_SCHSO|nr:unnamed protein product [Schistocephalus solidus]